MNDLAEYLAALALTTIAHPYGHISEGNKNDTPMTVHWDKGYERLSPRKPLTSYEQSNIHGAGFNFQDKIAGASTGDFKPKMSLANAIYKFLYNTAARRSSDYTKGDTALMGEHSKEWLLASALGNLYKWKNPDSNLSTEFAVIDGAPGIKLNYQW